MAANRNLLDPILHHKNDNVTTLPVERATWNDEVMLRVNEFLKKNPLWTFMGYVPNQFKCLFFCNAVLQNETRQYFYTAFIDDLDGGMQTCSLELAVKAWWTIDRKKRTYNK